MARSERVLSADPKHHEYYHPAHSATISLWTRLIFARVAIYLVSVLCVQLTCPAQRRCGYACSAVGRAGRIELAWAGAQPRTILQRREQSPRTTRTARTMDREANYSWAEFALRVASSATVCWQPRLCDRSFACSTYSRRLGSTTTACSSQHKYIYRLSSVAVPPSPQRVNELRHGLTL